MEKLRYNFYPLENSPIVISWDSVKGNVLLHEVLDSYSFKT